MVFKDCHLWFKYQFYDPIHLRQEFTSRQGSRRRRFFIDGLRMIYLRMWYFFQMEKICLLFLIIKNLNWYSYMFVCLIFLVGYIWIDIHVFVFNIFGNFLFWCWLIEFLKLICLWLYIYIFEILCMCVIFLVGYIWIDIYVCVYFGKFFILMLINWYVFGFIYIYLKFLCVCNIFGWIYLNWYICMCVFWEIFYFDVD